MAVVEEKGLASGREDYTQDGTVDLKCRPVLRSNTGRWRACSFIVGYEMIERMAYYGISSNLVLYLTKKLHEGTVKSSNHVTNWVGTVWMMPAAGAYIADAYLGRYWTFVIASAIYLLGMCLLTLAVSLQALRPPPCAPGVADKDCQRASSLQAGIFFSALYIIAAGTGGTKPNISTMGADQFDEFEPKERHRLPSGSPLTSIVQVFVAAMRKCKVHVPDDLNELHELSKEEYYASKGRSRIYHSSSLRLTLGNLITLTNVCSFLDKAAVKTGQTSLWILCTVTQVEETKQMMKMIPILITTCIPSTIIAQTSTLFIRQGTTLDRRMGPHFEIPPACLIAFVNIFMLISVVIYDRLFVPAIRLYTKNPRGVSLLQRLGIGLVLHVIIMLTACLVERKRLSVARENHLLGQHDTIPLTIFILLPQFAFTGIADTFVDVAKLEFFYDQAPEAMKSLGTSYFTTTLSIGNFLNTFLLSAVADLSRRHGRKGWILDNLNVSRLDYYYAFLAMLSAFNFLCFMVVAKFFVYNDDVTQTKMDLDMNPASSEDNTGISQSTPQPDAKS
ncbi:NRT1/ PTR FAMILY 5.2 [Spatholobus suberectus]|nr:NRT1/ PTR FAMILY 5.2 [Spatholobus suberectus]